MARHAYILTDLAVKTSHPHIVKNLKAQMYKIQDEYLCICAIQNTLAQRLFQFWTTGKIVIFSKLVTI